MTDAKGVECSAEDIATLARSAGGGIFVELICLARKARSESVKLGAIKEVLDRGYGRSSTQAPTPQDEPLEYPQRAAWTADESGAVPDPSNRS